MGSRTGKAKPRKKRYSNVNLSIVNFYWPDDYIYIIYKLANIEKFSNKKLLDFEYLRCPEKSAITLFNVLNTLYQHLDIEIDGFIFHKEILSYKLKD